eukprot:gene9307-11408_t
MEKVSNLYSHHYFYHIEQQHLKSKVFKYISNPLSSALLAYLIMAILVIIPLSPVEKSLAPQNLIYLLVYIPIVSVFCFAVFFSITYTFLNLPRIPYNFKTTIFFFFIVWILIQIGGHFLTMICNVFPIPFQWIIIAFGLGVPLIYAIVWSSISNVIKKRNQIQRNRSYSQHDRDIVKLNCNNINNNGNIEIPLEKYLPHPTISIPINNNSIQNTPEKDLTININENNNNNNNNNNSPTSSSPSTSSSTSTSSAGSSPNLSTRQNHQHQQQQQHNIPIPSTIQDINSKLNGSTSTTASTSILTNSESGLDMSLDSPRRPPLNEEEIEEIQDQIIKECNPSNQEEPKPFLFQFWVVASTLALGPVGYVFFHVFLFVFYSVNENLYQTFVIVAFQMIVLIYKFVFRLSFHRMRKHLPHIPLRVFQDGRILFLFWLELSSHCFFSMVFPHVGSWFMILVYLVIEATTLSLQIVVDTKTFRGYCIKFVEKVHEFLTGEKYTGQFLYQMLGQNGELDRTVSLEIFFFNCLARTLAGASYIIFSLAIYFGPNEKYYPTIHNLKESNYFMTLFYAGLTLATSLIQMYLFRGFLLKIYRINLIKNGIKVWRRKPDVAFFFITNCFILPLVVLLDHNNAVTYLLSNFT